MSAAQWPWRVTERGTPVAACRSLLRAVDIAEQRAKRTGKRQDVRGPKHTVICWPSGRRYYGGTVAR